jgi:hypothetical protein
MRFGATKRILATALFALLTGAIGAEAQGFYPRDWFFGRSGLFYRDYTTPTFDEPGYVYSNASSARSTSAGKFVFAAATVDDYCQQDGSPAIAILDAPPGGRIATDIGTFRASANDGGSKKCIGRTVRGTRVYYRGRSGGRVVLRVAYPTKGLTYDHVIAVR